VPIVEFWSLKTVVAAVGLSKTTIYREIAEGRFPPSRPYADNPGRRFWASTEVIAWQRRQVGDDFDALLAA